MGLLTNHLCNILHKRFGGRRRRGGPGRGGMQESTPIDIPLFVTLEELYNGKTYELYHKKQVLCKHCRGTGAENPDDVKKCPSCDGSGVKLVTQQLGPGFVSQMQTTCDKCGGKGKIASTKCPHCSGSKVETGSGYLYIDIERGMPSDHTIVKKKKRRKKKRRRRVSSFALFIFLFIHF